MGIVSVLNYKTLPGAYFIWISCVFDFLDGMTARAIRYTSPIGKDLDSLADVVSFGVLPACILYVLMVNSGMSAWAYLAFGIAIFSALRLAIFNNDETQTKSFKGLNTPSNSLFISALPLLPASLDPVITSSWFLVTVAIVSPFLLVAPIRFFSLKFENVRWEGNQIRFIFLGCSLLLLTLFHVAALPLIILLYIGLSLLFGRS